MTDRYRERDGVEAPEVPGSTYWCFTPDNLAGALAGWQPDTDPEASHIQRQIVREFLYSAGVLRAGMRKETLLKDNPVLMQHGE